jgi:quinohemoprotein ethanol dehydrogenase
MIPDLRVMSSQTHAQFKQIVLHGARADRGMAPFADVLSEQDADAIQAYIVDRARALLVPAPKSRETQHATDR